MASPALGRQGYVGIAKEAVRGTNVNPAYMVQALIGGGDKAAYVNSEGPDGTINQYSDSQLDQLMSDPTYAGDLYLDPLGLELLATLGKVTTTAGDTSNPTTHVFELADTTNEHQSLTVHDQSGPDSLQYPLCMVSELSVAMTLQQFIQRSISFMGRVGKSVTKLTGASLNVDNSQKFRAFQLTAKLAATATALSSAENLKVTAFDTKIMKNPKVAYVAGRSDRNPEYITAGETSAEANISIHYLNTDQKAKYLAGTKNALQVIMSNGATGAAERSVTFEYEKVTLPEFTRANDANEFLMQNIKIMPIKDNDSATAKLTKVTIKNAKSSY